jgi:polysaccharide deacetylase 2 family uncharacterized protein YibQ
LSTDDPTDDLQKPLGQSPKKKKKPFVLPIPVVTRGIAGMLGFCIAVLVGWILFVDEPFGGEPVAVVSALPNKTAAAPPSAKPDAAAPVALGETGKPAPAANTVTIIDGSTGKRQEVSVGQSGAAPAAQKKSEPRAEIKNAPLDPRLADTSRHGAIPKIASDGARPSEVYARPVTPSAGRTDAPRVAIVIEGLGIGSNSTAEALAKLPAPVTFAFAPYGTDLERWIGRARSEGHEVLLQIGMEPFDYPDNDPGPQTLLATLPPEQNIDRLHWFLSRFQGYVGVTSLMGARFTATDQALSPVLREVGKRGLIYFDDGTSPRSVASQISGAANVAFAKADAVLDAVPTAADIDNALARLEGAARSRGVAIGAASALPVSIERIAQWAKAAEGRGIVLVPVSMVANRAKSGS